MHVDDVFYVRPGFERMCFVLPQGSPLSPQYRNGGVVGPGDGGGGGPPGPPSPTSPLSQHSSYSPSQSPSNLSPSNLGGAAAFGDAYYQQQQLQQANALQHQFEQFNMVSLRGWWG